MPIPLEDLDDRSFADLVEEARSLIPTLAPDWTDHNPSDPGIAMVELLAWLTDMLMFRVNQITSEHIGLFLRLLNPPHWEPPPPERLADSVAHTVRWLREPYRAVTPADYEYLVRTVRQQVKVDGGRLSADVQALLTSDRATVDQVRCVPRRNFAASTAASRYAPAPSHVTVVIVPPGSQASNDADPPEYPRPQPVDAELAGALERYLDERRMLTTRHHVVGPEFVPVDISAVVALGPDAPAGSLAAVRDRLRRFLNPSPITGSTVAPAVADATVDQGWRLGRNLYLSEIYTVLERSHLVEYVDDVRLASPGPVEQDTPSREIRNNKQAVVGVALQPNQLIQLTKVELTGYDSIGKLPELRWTSS